MKSSIKVLILGGDKDSTCVVFRYLDKYFQIEKVILEKPPNRKMFLKRRIKRLGIVEVFGQILFQVIAVRFIRFFSVSKINKLRSTYALDNTPIPEEKVLRVSSVNSEESLNELQNITVDVIVVNGTRIISKRVLSKLNIPLINTHVGITPLYRGVHGGYWALVNDDRKNCGVTIHLIDEGIDTGGVIAQDIIQIDKMDNFLTYPIRQLATALPMLKEAVRNYDNLKEISGPEGESKLWYHPTIWKYFYNRIVKGIK